MATNAINRRARDEQNSPAEGKPFQLAEKQPDHERGLKRANAAAGFIHTHHPAADPNDAAFKLRRDTEQIGRLARDRRHDAHQALRHRHLEGRDPGDGYENKSDRKRKMPQSRGTVRSPDHEQRETNDHAGVKPGQRPPIGVAYLEETEREEQNQKCESRKDEKRSRRSLPKILMVEF